MLPFMKRHALRHDRLEACCCAAAANVRTAWPNGRGSRRAATRRNCNGGSGGVRQKPREAKGHHVSSIGERRQAPSSFGQSRTPPPLPAARPTVRPFAAIAALAANHARHPAAHERSGRSLPVAPALGQREQPAVCRGRPVAAAPARRQERRIAATFWGRTYLDRFHRTRRSPVTSARSTSRMPSIRSTP